MSLALYPWAVRGWTWPIMKTSDFDTIVQSSTNKFETRISNTQNPIWHWSIIYEYLKDNPQDLVASLSPYTDYRFMQGFLLSNQGRFNEFLFDDLMDDTIGMQVFPGGGVSTPSVFKISLHPTQQFPYPTGSYIVDNNPIPHLQLVTAGGIGGSTVPTFNTTGGSTTTGGLTVLDQGVFNGLNAQQLQLVQDPSTSIWYSPLQRNFGGQFYEDIADLNTTVYPLTVWADGVQQTAGGTAPNYTLHTGGIAIPGFSFYGDYLQWSAPPVAPITALCQFYFRVRLDSDQQDIEQFLQELWTIGGTEAKSGSGYIKLISSRVASL